MGAVCAEMFALSTHASGIFWGALNRKLLSQTSKCGTLVAKGLRVRGLPLSGAPLTIFLAIHLYKPNN